VFLEAFHAAGAVLPGGWRANQILAWLVFALSLWVLQKPRKTQGT